MRRALAVLMGAAALPGGLWACEMDAVRFDGIAARFGIEVADTPGERSQGLMNRQTLGSGQGMLFVYDRPGHPRFWMKDTLIPLDMIFMAPDGTVTRVHPMAQPLDETPVDGGEGVQYVLEINGGLAGPLGIAPGAVMVWPGLGQAARKPCP